MGTKSNDARRQPKRPTSSGPQRPPTPLRLFLDRHPAITAAEIGERMRGELDGEAPSPESLSQWSTGSRAPSARAQLAMSMATGGEVAPIDWTRWRAEIERMRRRPQRRRGPQ